MDSCSNRTVTEPRGSCNCAVFERIIDRGLTRVSHICSINRTERTYQALTKFDAPTALVSTRTAIPPGSYTGNVSGKWLYSNILRTRGPCTALSMQLTFLLVKHKDFRRMYAHHNSCSAICQFRHELQRKTKLEGQESPSRPPTCVKSASLLLSYHDHSTWYCRC